MTTPEDDSDEPQYSSSAECITLNMLGQNFDPEYTHQCFDGEWIRGYQPYHIHGTHKSHTNHETASHELQATVTLSPSCESCHVELSVRRKDKRQALAENRPKRRKLNTVEENSTFEDSNDEEEDGGNENDDDDEEYGGESSMKESETEDDHSDAGSTRRRRMHPNEILERLGRALPKISLENKELVEDDHLRQPIGKTIKTYTRQGTDGSADEEFILTLADNEEAADYHEQVQNLALFFIESADGVSLKHNNAGGYWKAMYLFQKRGTRRYALCGYLTLFHFSSPFRKPKPGTIVRVCQALLLPPYQRRGHGKAMLRTVHDVAKESDDIVEINVEDPAPGFIALRNLVDYELLLESLDSEEPWLTSKYLKRNDFPTLADKDATAAATLGRITKQQAQIAYEVYKLKDLPFDNADVEKQYRLMVKKRLLKLHHLELSVCKTKEERQVLLAEKWREVFHDYNMVLKRN
jgi:histone acetyltransferase 1